MIRAAAKNHAYAAPVVSPESYDAVLDELRESDRRLSLATRESLAAEAFAYTARYDTAIARWFQEKREDFPPLFVRAFEKVLELPYGENPHQRAAYYEQVGARTHVLSMVSQLGGKPISFNNLLDLDAGRLLLIRVPDPGVRDHQAQQPVWGGGGIDGARGLQARLRLRSDVGLRRRRVPQPPRRRRAGQASCPTSSSRSCSPAATTTARWQVLAEKPNTRILDDRERRTPNMIEPHLRQVVGGMLVQDRDADIEERGEMQVVTERRPTEAEWQELSFAWKVCKHVKSNAIVIMQAPVHDRHRRRPDEPRRRSPAGAGEGARRRGRRRARL